MKTISITHASLRRQSRQAEIACKARRDSFLQLGENAGAVARRQLNRVAEWRLPARAGRLGSGLSIGPASAKQM